MQTYAQKAGSGVVVQEVRGPFETLPPSKELGAGWFDLERFKSGVRFSLTNSPGPTVYVDTNRQCFYFFDTD
jgi:hypothetical protein